MYNIKGTVSLYGSDGKKRYAILELVAIVSIYSMIIPLMFADVCAILYVNVYFRIYDIPMIPRKDYVRIERYKLHKLNLLQKLACMYCEYANGIVAWLKAVINQTETYSCAIKQGGPVKGQEHRMERNFKDFAEFL